MQQASQADIFSITHLEKKFRDYHLNNPHVWREFEKLSWQLIRAGRTRFGAQMIIEVMRWNTAISAENDEFKINNNYAAHYARMFMAKYPQYRGFFTTRELRS